MIAYTPLQLVGLFFVYSFLGWCLEVAYAAVTSGKIVNRGFLNGPVCPIYGVGMLAVLLLLEPMQHNLLLLMLGGTALATTTELVGGWALMKLFHTRWWDYSQLPFNLGGYICLKFSLLWGLGTVGMVRVFHPAIREPFLHLPEKWLFILLIPSVLLFCADLAATVAIVVGFNRELKELEELAAAMRRSSDALTQKVGNAALTADERLDRTRLDWELAKAEGREEWEKLRDEWETKALRHRRELEEQLENLAKRREERHRRILRARFFGARRLLNAFPRLRHNTSQSLIEELREYANNTK